MNQKLSDWASIAEIVSGIAVVITIVFLVVGIRGNTEITRAAVYDRNIDSLNAWRLSVAQDEDLLRVWDAYLQDDTEGFTGEDHRRMDLILSALWGIYEKSYYSNQYGILGSSEWSRFEARLCPNSTESEELWQEVVARLLTEEFVNFVRLSVLMSHKLVRRNILTERPLLAESGHWLTVNMRGAAYI